VRAVGARKTEELNILSIENSSTSSKTIEGENCAGMSTALKGYCCVVVLILKLGLLEKLGVLVVFVSVLLEVVVLLGCSGDFRFLAFLGASVHS